MADDHGAAKGHAANEHAASHNAGDNAAKPNENKADGLDDIVANSFLEKPDSSLSKAIRSPYMTAFSVGWKTAAALLIGTTYFGVATIPAILATGVAAAGASYAVKKTEDYLLEQGYFGAAVRFVKDAAKFVAYEVPKGIIEGPLKKAYNTVNTVTNALTKNTHTQGNAQPHAPQQHAAH